MKDYQAKFLSLPFLGIFVFYLFHTSSGPVEVKESQTEQLKIDKEIQDNELEKHSFIQKNKTNLGFMQMDGEDESPLEKKKLSAFNIVEVLDEGVAAVSKTVSGKEGFVVHKLVKTDLKYPYVLIEETVSENQSNEHEVLSKVEMIADHMMVQKSEDLSKDEFESELLGRGWVIRKQINDQGLYLIETRGKLSMESLRASMTAITSEVKLKYVEPDFVFHPVAMPNDSRFLIESAFFCKFGQATSVFQSYS